jgi:hypothetical protein
MQDTDGHSMRASGLWQGNGLLPSPDTEQSYRKHGMGNSTLGYRRHARDTSLHEGVEPDIILPWP